LTGRSVCLSLSRADAAQARTRVEDVMPIATGLEREEIAAELQVNHLSS
jgi:cytochrome c oxidase subunit 5b